MHLGTILDSAYLAGSLWGVLNGNVVCTSSVSPVPGAVRENEVAWVPGREAPAGVTAFVDVNVVPMDQERVLLNQTVVIASGRITALGPVNKVKVPTGAVRIDGRGKYLMPGLADMHVHDIADTKDRVREAKNRLFPDLASGVTAFRYLTQATDDFQQLWRDSLLAEVPSPHLYAAPKILFLKRDSLGKDIVSVKLDSVAAQVTAAKAMGYHHLMGTMFGSLNTTNAPHYREERTGFDSIIAAARRVRLPVSAHTHGIPFDAMLALGTTGGATEHVYGYFENLGFWKIPRGREPAEVPLAKLQALAAVTQRAGLWVTPTLHCTTAKADYSSYTPTHIKIMRQLVKALQDAGVGLLLGGDDGFSVHDELAALVGAGLTPYQALVTGTRNAAQYLRLLDSAGTVAVGKRADLVLVSDNPLEDVRHAREPAGVMIQGHWLDRAALDQHLVLAAVALYPQPTSSNGGPHAAWKTWLASELLDRRITPGFPDTLEKPFNALRREFAALADTLAAAPQSPGAEDARGRLAEVFGATRALVPAEHQAWFDALARVWLREQARQGYQVVIPGITPVP